MAQDKEHEIRCQFLDEAQEYLNTLDSALLGLADSRVDGQKINAALRAAHSIKGGASMMGFQVLSDLAHHLEDSFKVLKTQKAVVVDSQLENLLLGAVGSLHQVIDCDRQGIPVDAEWLQTEVEPIFQQLHNELGDPQAEDATSILSPEEGNDIISILFETEVEGCLQRLEAVLKNPDQPCLHEELMILAQELDGLGEMLQLPAFISLCQSVGHYLEAMPDAVEAIAHSALQAWRQTQTLVLSGNLSSLPTALENLPAIAAPANLPEDMPLQWQEEAEDILIGDDMPADFLISPVLPTSTMPEEELLEVAMPTIEPPVQTTSRRSRTRAKESQVTDFRVLELKPDPKPAATNTDDQDTTVRVPVRQLHQLNDLFGELTIERNGLELYLKRLRTLMQSLSQRVQRLDKSNAQMRSVYDKVTIQAVTPLRSPLVAHGSHSDHPPSKYNLGSTSIYPHSKLPHPGSDDSIRSHFDVLEMDRYTDLQLLSQQVMETIVQVQEVTSDLEISLDDAEQTSRDLAKTARQLQTSLTQIRMRPLSDILDRFPRALRELCLQHGKKARLVINGGSTLIDRNVLESLNDPLMHLLRNAFDHGIEDPETRLAKGKLEEGVIEIRAAQRGNRTLITISDDGNGIPIDKIRARAEQMGLDVTLLSAASDEELLSLIFEPGFSTSERVTTLSGRGVGMDVVREGLRHVRGEIKVDTRPGLGTTFTLSVPFTLSIVQALLAESNGMLLAFPTDAIAEMVLLDSEEIITTAGSEVLNWQGTLVQIIHLANWLEFRCPRQPHTLEDPPTINVPAVLMVNQGNQLVGLRIDRCWGEREVAIRRVEGTLPLPAGFSGCTVMGDGRVVPLVNTADLLHWINNDHHEPLPSTIPLLPASAPRTEAPPLLLSPASMMPSHKAAILIVDDSINVRRFLALTLERAGYQVEQAKDGQDALEKLQAGLVVHGVICDIEMPRMDGYAFLAKVKATSHLEHLPIAMLTSRSSDKHRQLAMSLGASAYFTKPYNEQTLLRNLEQFITS
jgi:chemosensory pili system protein ChpA (sensor histidine kinase/response regulator)